MIKLVPAELLIHGLTIPFSFQVTEEDLHIPQWIPLGVKILLILINVYGHINTTAVRIQ